eukprot:maker-scaffold98_size375582-snap-gene-1.14 protein:Tk06120 transcript:maker-scaffold98_size375582-snap-gene-1.14-mRNA-1 annotation:"wd repeat-containing protein 85-like"
MGIQTRFTWDTHYSADTVEWCPSPEYPDVLAVGTYQVDKSDEASFSASQRKGRVYIHVLNPDRSLELKFQLDTSAILDMRWHPQGPSPILAVVDALGVLTLYELLDSYELRQVEQIKVTPEEDGETLALSIDWNCRRDSPDRALRIVTSDSKGSISLMEISPDSKATVMETRKCHDYESWICAFDAWNSEVIYSGGDDSILLAHDLRMERPAFKCREHMAGVTSLLSDVHHEFRLLSGSYDETLYVWDTRTLKSSLATHKLGGGVWRIKQSGKLPDVYATACMSNGLAMLTCQADTGSLEVSDRYTEHESLAYGVDFHSQQVGLLASCSFYDHGLKIWDWEDTREPSFTQA